MTGGDVPGAEGDCHIYNRKGADVFDNKDPKAIRRRQNRISNTTLSLPEHIAFELDIAAQFADSTLLAELQTRSRVRVAVIGDIHGEAGWAKRVLKDVSHHNIDVAVFVGDFGYWVHTNDGRGFLNEVNRLAILHGIVVMFIDGNHDNHDFLALLPRQNDLTAAVRSHVVHAGRGWRAQWGGVTVAALGGAVSTDQFIPPGRVAGYDWWAGEAVTQDDVDLLCSGGPVDVLLTHDAPTSVTSLAYREGDPVSQQASDTNRLLIQQAVDVVRPQLLVHGHHHTQHSTEVGWIDRAETDRTGELVWASTQVEGLDMDGSFAKNWLLLDLDGGDLTVTTGATAAKWWNTERTAYTATA